MSRTNVSLLFLVVVCVLAAPLSGQDKPNILVIFADDVGMWNISTYS
jgi:hypothetical protein